MIRSGARLSPKWLSAKIYVPLVVWYLFMVCVFPTDQATMARRHLDMLHARVVSLSVALPLIAIWLIALYGARRLQTYARSLKHHPDGPPFALLAQGITALAFYLPIRSVVKITLGYVGQRYPALLNSTNIIITYVNILVPLYAFYFINAGAQDLGHFAKLKGSLKHFHLIMLLFIGLSVAYCLVIFHASGDIPPTNWLVTTQSAIPWFWRITTVIIPQLFIWFLGFEAVYMLYLYQRQVKGILYRQTLRLLSLGLVMVISVSIAMQFVTATAPQLQKLSFGLILALAYSLIALLGVAFGCLAIGARRLEKLDQV